MLVLVLVPPVKMLVILSHFLIYHGSLMMAKVKYEDSPQGGESGGGGDNGFVAKETVMVMVMAMDSLHRCQVSVARQTKVELA